MNCSTLKRMLRKGHSGTFRPLKPGEAIEASDIACYDTFLEGISESNIGQLCGDNERIIRLEFQEKLK
jgi:hypothetical protein